MKREWTLITAFVAAVLNWLVGFDFSGLSAGQASLWMAAISAVAAVVVALQTRPIAPQAFTYLVTVLAGLGAAYGFHLSPTAVGSVSALVLAGLALLTRGQVSPKADAPTTGVLGGVAPESR